MARYDKFYPADVVQDEESADVFYGVRMDMSQNRINGKTVLCIK